MAAPTKHTAGFSVIAEQKDGEFLRKPSVFRNFVRADGSTEFPVEAGRYHLYVANACPWANGTSWLRKVKGLEDVIGLSIVGPVFQKTSSDPEDKHRGWMFEDPKQYPDTVPDPIFNAKSLREVYEKLADGPVEKYTTPLLVDVKAKKIVNNESTEILRMFNTEFNAIAKHPEVDLCPAELQGKMDEVNEWVYHHINNGVYRSGFASKQEAYMTACTGLFEHLDKAEEILSQQRYICSNDKMTIIDLRLFMTLIRFDDVYATHFKCTKKRIKDYPNLSEFCRELFQVPGGADTIHFEHIRQHYYLSHQEINPHVILPLRVETDWNAPHDRERFSK